MILDDSEIVMLFEGHSKVVNVSTVSAECLLRV